MSVAHQQRVAAPEPGSDRAVVEAVRAGQVGQYALLYERYRAEALRIARRQVGPDEAQDLVQETFARVLRAIQNGGGPTEDVAGYIFRTLR
ncbi:MAG TPA: sigma factor, partial [Ruania sp.]|nr:sigma factor [Ruania sp.]